MSNTTSVACRSGPNKIHELGRLLKAGARSNKYRIIHPDFGDEMDILCTASSMPGRSIGQVEVFLKGRKYQMAGDMTDEGTWTVTIYNTENFMIRDFFLEQIGLIQSFEAPETLGGYPKPADIDKPWYTREITIQQLGSDGEVLTTAVLSNAFVSEINAVDYNDETGEITKSEITFTYSGITYQGKLGRY